MADLRPYDPSKPLISVNLPTKEELIAATLGLIPGYRALRNMYDNPEGPVTETLDIAAEDLVPLYGSVIKPAIKGEDIDAEQALREFALFGSQPGGPSRALGSLPIKLNKSKLNYVVRPESGEELLKLHAALREAVKKGEMTKADAEKLLVNAATNMHQQSILEGKAQRGSTDLNSVDHPVPANPIEKSTVAPSDIKKYEDAFGLGNRLGNMMRIKPQGLGNNGDMIYLHGDQGPLWINEHNKDAANIRHNLTNYDELVGNMKMGYGPILQALYDKYPSKGGYIQRLNLKNGSNKELYKTVVEPQALKWITGPKLGYDYKKAQNTPVNEGRKATTERSDYKTVDELYKIILGLK